MTARQAPRIGLHPNTSGGYYIVDTETHVYQYPKVVVVEVVMMPHLRSWSLPDAETLRRQIDGDLKDTGFERTGRRIEGGGHLMNKWVFHYPIKAVGS